MFGCQRVTSMKYFIVLLFIVLSSCSDAQSKLPSRSECIVKVSFSNEKKSIEKIYPNLFEDVRRLSGNNLKIKSPSLVVSADNRNVLYLQYKEKCSEKFDFTSQILNKTVVALPEYKISKEKVSPSPSTIDVQGVYWKDKN